MTYFQVLCTYDVQTAMESLFSSYENAVSMCGFSSVFVLCLLMPGQPLLEKDVKPLILTSWQIQVRVDSEG